MSEEMSEHWILLYYQYCAIPNVQESCKSQEQLCERLQLKGRVRVSDEGINGTLGGSACNIHEYMSIVDGTSEFDAVRRPIHWKLSRLTDGVVQRKFSDLSIKAVKEVVSLDLPEAVRAAVMKTDTGQHLQPREFHEILQKVSKPQENASKSIKPSVVMIDARNLYETRIGQFRVETPSGTLQPMNPQSRQFSDFVRYIDGSVDALNGRQVLMYCTGGVRCERASAYVRYALARVGGTVDVYQLSGGIHAYMEEYPEGGYFKGKNFVFDPRIAIPTKRRQHSTEEERANQAPTSTSSSTSTSLSSAATTTVGAVLAAPPIVADEGDDIIGRCLLCETRFDDYSKQHRCGSCRMLVLVCDACHAKRQQQQQDQQQDHHQQQQQHQHQHQHQHPHQQQHQQQQQQQQRRVQQQQQNRQRGQKDTGSSLSILICESCQSHLH